MPWRSFEITQSRTVTVCHRPVDVGPDRAQASGRREHVVVVKRGERLHTETRFVRTLVRQPQGGTIQELREAPRDPESSREAR